MMWRAFRLLLICMLPAVVMIGCADPKNTATIRYRVIVTAMVDGEAVEGSSVMEMTYTRIERSLLGTGGSASLKGEAVILDLKGRGTVYVLPIQLDRNGSLSEVYQGSVLASFGVHSSIGSLEPDDLQRLRAAQGRVPLFIFTKKYGVPLFVAFHDESNPRSIYQVDPDHLDAAFRSGVHLIGIDLEVTDAPITHVLVQRLPWLRYPLAIDWEREPAGSRRPMKEWPLGFKITAEKFFGNGSR